MIVKLKYSKHKEFEGVNFEVLASGKKSMVTKMNYKLGDNVPFHSHPNEQSGYVISGEHLVQIGQIQEVLGPGEVIDLFITPRADYL